MNSSAMAPASSCPKRFLLSARRGNLGLSSTYYIYPIDPIDHIYPIDKNDLFYSLYPLENSVQHQAIKD